MENHIGKTRDVVDWKKLIDNGKSTTSLVESVFPDYLDEVRTWERPWGGQGLGRLRSVLAHRPGEEARIDEAKKDPALARELAQLLNLPEGIPDLEKLQKEHDGLTEILKGEGVEINWLNPEPPLVSPTGLPLRSLHYCGITLINGGAINARYCMPFSFGWSKFFTRKYSELGIPVLISVIGKGIFELANIRWLSNKSCIIATSNRTNMDAIDQLLPVLKRVGVEEIHIAHLPSSIGTREWQVGDGAGTFHLDMVFGMADYNVAVLYPSLIDYDTIRYLKEKGITLIECTSKELHLCAPNILAIEPGKVIISANCEDTTRKLAREGVDVIEVDMVETAKGGGGPTCSIGVLIRDGSLPANPPSFENGKK
jgi:N-dimethylarginine dimethylaminohydrolase